MKNDQRPVGLLAAAKAFVADWDSDAVVVTDVDALRTAVADTEALLAAARPEVQLYSKQEAAALLKVTPNHIDHLIKTAGLPYVKLGKVVRIRHMGLGAWLASQEKVK